MMLFFYIHVLGNINKIWDQHFVHEDDMKLLRRFPSFDQDSVSEASGQVDIDTDHMFKDEMTHELKHILAVLYDLCPEQHGASNEFDNVKASTGNPFFETQLDIEYKCLEIAQGISNCFKVQSPAHSEQSPTSTYCCCNHE